VPALDTTCLIDLLRRRKSDEHRRIITRLAAVRASGQVLCTTRINEAELWVGVERATDRANELQAVAAVLSTLIILDLNESAARQFGAIIAYQQRIGRPAGDMDALVAAIALAHGQSLITRNPKHFADVPGLVVEGY